MHHHIKNKTKGTPWLAIIKIVYFVKKVLKKIRQICQKTRQNNCQKFVKKFVKKVVKKVVKKDCQIFAKKNHPFAKSGQKSNTNLKFLEAPLVWQADGKLKHQIFYLWIYRN